MNVICNITTAGNAPQSTGCQDCEFCLKWPTVSWSLCNLFCFEHPWELIIAVHVSNEKEARTKLPPVQPLCQRQRTGPKCGSSVIEVKSSCEELQSSVHFFQSWPCSIQWGLRLNRQVWNKLQILSFCWHLITNWNVVCAVFSLWSRRRLCNPFEEYWSFARWYGKDVFCRNCAGTGISPQLWHRSPWPKAWQVRF